MTKRDDALWQELRDLFGLDGWHDGHYNGVATPEKIVTHCRYVANERARLLMLVMKSTHYIQEASMLDDPNAAQAELPKYQSHKKVWALKIREVREHPTRHQCAIITPADAGYAPFTVNAEYVAKHDPKPGGYYVVYPDGYASFSPAGAFEDGYTRIVPEVKNKTPETWPELTDARARAFYNAFIEAHITRGMFESIQAGYRAMKNLG